MIKLLRGTEAQRKAYGGLEVGRVLLTTDRRLVWIGTASGDTPIGTATELMIAEIFDGLTTGDINGQGIYGRCAPWIGTEVGTGTAEVTVKAGADKMLRLASGAPVVDNYGAARLDINVNSKISSGIFKYKVRVSSVTKAFDCFQFQQDGTSRFIIALGDASQMRCRWGTANWTNLVAIANNTWYTVEVHWSSASQIITVFVDSVYRGYFTLHTDSRCEYINRLYSRCYSDTLNGDIDDLEIVNFGVYPYQI